MKKNKELINLLNEISIRIEQSEESDWTEYEPK